MRRQSRLSVNNQGCCSRVNGETIAMVKGGAGGGEFLAPRGVIHYNPTRVAAAHTPCVFREVGVAWGCGLIHRCPIVRESVAGGKPCWCLRAE